MTLNHETPELPASWVVFVFETLLEFAVTGDSSCTQSLADFSGAEIVIKENSKEELIVQHLTLSQRLFALRALPFLPDESRLEYQSLSTEILLSWEKLMNYFPQHFQQRADRLSLHEVEAIDFQVLTCLEWMHDISFINASVGDRKSYLTEFPFSFVRGQC